MKRTLILAGLLAATTTANAQWLVSGSNTYYSPLWYNVGIGLTAPAYKLDVKTASSFDDGLHINNSGYNNYPSIYLDNTYGGSTYSHNWVMQSTTSSGGGNWLLKDLTSGNDAIRAASTGQIDIGTTTGGFNGRVHVATTTDSRAIMAENNGGTTGMAYPIGIGGYVPGNGAAGSMGRAFLGYAYNSEENRGGEFIAFGGNTTKGVNAQVWGAGIENYGGYFDADAGRVPGTTAYGVFSKANSTGFGVGVYGESNGNAPSGSFHYGGLFTATDANNLHNIGGTGVATGGTDFNIGLCGWASAAGPAMPPLSFMTPYPKANIGVYGTACLTGAYASPSNNWAGWFDNDVNINGFAYCNSSAWSSDRKFKNNIKPVENATSIISQLKPSTYYFNTKNDYGMNFSDKKQYGFISQEVETVLPDLISNVHKPASAISDGKETTKEVDYKALNYIGFIALLTKGMQEQQEMIASQQKQIDELKAIVQSLASNTGAGNINPAAIPVNLSDKNTVVLNQNVPNPFAESTVISYNITTDFTRAQVLITTAEGKVIKAVDITQKGPGSLNVFANDLSNGIYSYTLVVDGKTVDAKKMVKN